MTSFHYTCYITHSDLSRLLWSKVECNGIPQLASPLTKLEQQPWMLRWISQRRDQCRRPWNNIYNKIHAPPPPFFPFFNSSSKHQKEKRKRKKNPNYPNDTSARTHAKAHRPTLTQPTSRRPPSRSPMMPKGMHTSFLFGVNLNLPPCSHS